MPLEKGKSKAAFKHNVGAEISAGKKPAQAVAVAYSEKRRSKPSGQVSKPMKKSGRGR